jgi:hypothetical protein
VTVDTDRATIRDMDENRKDDRKPVPFDDVVRRLLKVPAAPASKQAKAKRKKQK